VLIAFVIVAAIFAYVVLTAGILFSGESQSTVHRGVHEAGSSITLARTVYGVSKTRESIDYILIPIELTAGGEPIDMNTVSIRIVGQAHARIVTQNVPLIDVCPKVGSWSVQERFNADSDALLEGGERYVLNISPDIKTDYKPYKTFVVEIKPAGRAALRVERTVPGSIDKITSLT